MSVRRCLGCMQTYEAVDEMCPYCGYIDGTPAKEAYHIQPGSLLHDRYTVGRAIGFGGFGITYIAWDNKLMQKVAIKEYMPSEYATRVPGNLTVTIYDGERYAEFMTGLQKFLDEAQRLAKFQNVPGIVRILDSFSENLTAYIVMEYLDGMTLKQYLAEHNEKLPYEEAVEFILPVLAALQAVHKEGIIHRDISPDNIFITKDGEVKLLDFGAARYASTGYSKSLSVILKPGYAPAEQYLSHGEQGPWSDVYATAATLYRMVTGVVPEEALERKEKDSLKAPSALGAKLPKNAEKAILNALNVRVENRTASAAEFETQLLSTSNVIRITEKGEKRFNAKMPVWLKASIIAAASLAAACIVLFATGVLKLGIGNRLIFNSALFDGGGVNTPGVINLTQEEGNDAATRQGLTLYVTGAYESVTAAKGIIMSQDPSPGTKVPAGSRLRVEVSSGPQYALVPDIIDTLWENSETDISAAGFIPKVFHENSDTVPEGAVISLGHSAGESFQVGEKLKVVVSSGPEGELARIPVDMPNISGMNYDEAKALLNKNGLRVIRENDQYSMTVPKGEVITQSISAGEHLMTGDIVYVSISMGVEQTSVPNVQYLSRREAIAALQDAKLAFTIKEEESDTVRKDLVIQQSVEAGSIVDIKTNVTITISLGKLADMPSLVGSALNRARSEMSSLGFENVTYTGKYDADTAENVVMSQSVPAGRHISVEDYVEIIYSMGKMPVEITLDADGGEVGRTHITAYYPDTYGSLPTPTKSGYIFQGWFSAALQSVVTSNSTVPEAETDVLTALWEPKRVEMPQLVGLSTNGARSKLTSLECKNVVYTGKYDASAAENTVLAQSVPAGTWISVEDGIEITYSLGKMPVHITLDANGGRVSPSSMTTYYPATYGTLPTPTRDFYTFRGWYSSTLGTTVTGGSAVPETEYETLTAVWEANPLSGWVRADSVPQGVQVAERKYVYDQTEYTTSQSSSMSGWELYDSKRELSDYGSWSAWSTTPISATDNRMVDTKTESTQVLTGYNMVEYNTRDNYSKVRQYRSYSIGENYSTYGLDAGYGEHYRPGTYSVDEVNNATQIAPGGRSSGSAGGINMDSRTGYVLYYGGYNVIMFIDSENYSWQDTTYYRYAERSETTIYYFKRTVQQESTFRPSGNDVRNIVEYVRYRSK